MTKREHDIPMAVWAVASTWLPGRLSFFDTPARLLLIDVNRIFLVDRSVIRSKIESKKKEREKQFVNAGTARIPSLEKKDAVFFSQMLLCFIGRLQVFLSSADDGRRQKSWRFDERRQVWLVKLRGSPLTVIPFRVAFLEQVSRRR